ncbi:MAG: prepilin-type N-terminal cleavage/methylation domain-containing protein [Deltaproteobacteria bacterium]|nr:prepilin-type N-terminal cleavage/methylation domain-containing protein [Deltaproteobacteria bacterium]
MRRAGFTIIEILITLTIMALLFGVSFKVVRSGFESEGRRLMQRLQGTIKYFSNTAAVSGNTYRLVFDLAEQRITIEMTEGAYISGGKPLSEEAQEALAKGEAATPARDATATEGNGEAEVPSTDGEEGEEGVPPLTLVSPTTLTFGPAEGPRGLIRPYPLPKKVLLREAFPAGVEKALTEGKVYLHCYPNGRVDPLTLIFANETEERFFVLQTNPVTGLSHISRQHPFR